MFDRLKEEINSIKARDPAVRSALEVIFLYPSFKAVRSYRRAHWFYEHGHFFIARWISQSCRNRTGIEIHPALRIGKGLFIDHGAGVVIARLLKSATTVRSTRMSHSAAPARTLENATRHWETTCWSARAQEFWDR